MLLIELNGNRAASGLRLLANGSVVRGLVINRFGSSGIFFAATNTTVEGNFIGTDATG